MLICTPRDRPAFEATLGDGSHFGVRLSYTVQPEPRGLAEAFIVGEEFIGKDSVCLVLGDNLFYGVGVTAAVQGRRAAHFRGADLRVPREGSDAVRRGGIHARRQGRFAGGEAGAPAFAVRRCRALFYDNNVISIAKALEPSPRGELEITDVNRAYLAAGALRMSLLGRGTAWLDTGSPDGLLQASNFIQTVEARQGLKIGCLEEVAFRKGFINREELRAAGAALEKTEYGQYLLALAVEHT